MCSAPQQSQSNNTQRHQNMNTIPADKYVICGRGKINAKHPGNKRFTKIIQANLQSYANADSKIDKVIVVTAVVNFFRENGIKFVTFDASNQDYVEITSERIHTKVSHAIRDQIKQNERDYARRANWHVKHAKSGPAPVEKQSTKSARSATRCKTVGKTTTSNTRAAPFCGHGSLALKMNPAFSAASSQGHDVFSKAIFDLGSKIEGTFSSDWDHLLESPLLQQETTPPASPLLDMMPEPSNSGLSREVSNEFPLPASMHALSPLPVNSDMAFEYQDAQRISLILDDQEENDCLGVVPLLEHWFPEQCYSQITK